MLVHYILKTLPFAKQIVRFTCLVVSVMMFPVMQILDGYLIWEPEKNVGKGVSTFAVVYKKFDM